MKITWSARWRSHFFILQSGRKNAAHLHAHINCLLLEIAWISDYSSLICINTIVIRHTFSITVNACIQLASKYLLPFTYVVTESWTKLALHEISIASLRDILAKSALLPSLPYFRFLLTTCNIRMLRPNITYCTN